MEMIDLLNSETEAFDRMVRSITTFLAIMANYGIYIFIAIAIFFLMLFVVTVSTNRAAEETKKEIESLRKEIEAMHAAHILKEHGNGENAK